ncbi:MAG: hypothetical protein US71_C0004G0027 [Parcubacteria group bacterium GW2011_GWD2_38_12]|uniref:Uncharacterized protein n=1 Tax=Candidatus Azambacteria bacterium RIFCSPLOWO2_01_FULL_37_9 TaxID=1797297 RepID=A0A1F5C9F5_9BACT|nr:MAG: hypothetical protein US06_C0007G0015 [Parcubacteria group bacterium GW2011_GWC2_36_17]KKQ40512.1 MAG: hypothetical protein US56_C0003G0007 [Candidatus Moranbacteria bacterium GW2011_GWF2_37_7]KKQ43449.1 MAG: hypothetical protein US61_C0011G0005 [Parcubacteria group bacterium GW2011_GWE2_37_8]KKQ52302.1 MAG: hypothetical protein US71_C0004G0027 [Parcubacteria group bacterium GW2011_GWD2_38_12]KKQ58587.1 MAG: hypothetical protein US79_C0005G0039 [Parcubacteria group bacterium GW2011_GWC1_
MDIKSNLLIIIAILSLLMGALGGGVFIFMRSKLRARRRRIKREEREELERLVKYSECPQKIDLG